MNPTENYLLNTLAALMDIDGAELCCVTPLDQQGVDSFVGLRLAKKIEKDTGVAISLRSISTIPICATSRRRSTPAPPAPDPPSILTLQNA